MLYVSLGKELFLLDLGRRGVFFRTFLVYEAYVEVLICSCWDLDAIAILAGG